MKKIENNFAVTGFVGKDAEIRQFTNRFSSTFLIGQSAVSEKNGEENQSAYRLS
jgi:single-strand DNA-binding protein